MSKVTPKQKFHGVPITRWLVDGEGLWKARDIGVALGFTSNGGNLTRNYLNNEEWIKKFKRRTDYDDRAADPRTGKGRTCLWLTDEGLQKTLEFLGSRNDKYSGIAKALLLFVKSHWSGQFKKVLDDPGAVELVLGAGMAVRYNAGGITQFVFMTEDDETHRIPVGDLDKGWSKKLQKAMKGWKRR